jgi:hypothetical protein
MRSTTSKNDNDGCPNSFQLELECLGGLQSSEQKTSIRKHSKLCKRCKENSASISRYYAILTDEVSMSASNRLLDFIRTTSKLDLKGGVIICSRLPQADHEDFQAYQTNGQNGNSKLSHYNPSFISEGQILLRVLQHSDKKAFIFIYSPNTSKTDKQVIQFADCSNTIHLNRSGAAQIKCSSIDELDKKTLYFSQNGNGSSRDELHQRIINSVFF